MCGFFQVIQKNSAVNRDRFRDALASMQHRGPDQSGELFLEKKVHSPKGEQTLHFGFGHQRLSILDLSEKSKQPFVIDQNILLYNGELYNFRELNQDLRSWGHELNTTGDTETLFKSVLDQGASALKTFNGMWSFSMYREASKTLFLSRDRYGKKPLFYYQDENIFCLSSTIYAIQVYLHRKISLRKDILSHYLTYGTLFPSNDESTPYNNISKILPGHWGEFDLTAWTLRQECYFNFNNEHLNQEPPVDSEHLTEILKDSVRKRLISDRPVGLLLSGGIDSTLILSILSSLGFQDQCHVYMGDTGKSEDYDYAKRCADKIGVHAQTILLDYDHNTFERFLKICRHHEKPFSLSGSAMAMPQMYEAISSHGIPVVLDGTGGDEIFGGYRSRQIPFAIRDAVKAHDWAWVLAQLRQERGVRATQTLLMEATLSPSKIADQHSKKMKKKALLNPFFKVEKQIIMESSPSDPLLNPSLSFTEALCADTAPGGRLGEWLWHNDRNSMMSSVEARSPILDYRLNQFIHTSSQEKFSSCWSKLELRRTFDALMPLPSQWRREKQGFRWDCKRFLYNNKANILELIRENKCLTDLVDIQKLVEAVNKQPKLLQSAFCRQVLVISGVERALTSF